MNKYYFLLNENQHSLHPILRHRKSASSLNHHDIHLLDKIGWMDTALAFIVVVWSLSKRTLQRSATFPSIINVVALDPARNRLLFRSKVHLHCPSCNYASLEVSHSNTALL